MCRVLGSPAACAGSGKAGGEGRRPLTVEGPGSRATDDGARVQCGAGGWVGGVPAAQGVQACCRRVHAVPVGGLDRRGGAFRFQVARSGPPGRGVASAAS
jgi:hypothetical protein